MTSDVDEPPEPIGPAVIGDPFPSKREMASDDDDTGSEKSRRISDGEDSRIADGAGSDESSEA